jgi:hypothetical protein
MSLLGRLFARIWRFLGREETALFGDIPPTFGNTVPPELRVFEAEMEEHEHEAEADPWDLPHAEGNPGAEERRPRGKRAEPPPRSDV